MLLQVCPVRACREEEVDQDAVDFKKCEKVCAPHCKIVEKKLPKKTCYYGKCHTTYITFKKNVCKSHCEKTYKVIEAVCPKTEVYQLVKFCAKLKCDAEAVAGSTVAPGDIVGVKAKLFKTIPGERELVAVADANAGGGGSHWL